MYADRVEAVTRKSIKERINGNDDDDSRRRRQISGKRHREEDDKWVHDLYEPHEFQGSNQRVATKDLRLKLQRRRSIQQAAQLIKGSLSGGTRDLREKLSGTVYSQTEKTDAPRKKLKAIPEVSQPTKSSVIAETTATDTKYVAGKVSKKKSQQKGAVFLWKGPSTFNHEIRGSSYQRKQNRIGPLLAPFSESAWGEADSVDRFLQSLGLEKYAITFEAEEVDMAALVHMTDEDLKAMGIPMGPRKKILLALESKV